MKPKMPLVVAVMALTLVPRAGAQNNNHTPGTAVSWGRSLLPFVAPGTQFITNLTANDHNLALKSDGTVVAWGYNAYGQSTVPGNLSGVIAVAAGYWHSLALKADGTVVAWGDNSSGESAVPTNLNSVIAIAVGYRVVPIRYDRSIEEQIAAAPEVFGIRSR